MNEIRTIDGIRFTVNGRAVVASVPPGKRLADVLRDDLGLTGTKVGCNAGDCGACTVLLDGEAVCACMVPAAQAAGRGVVTVEGLAAGDEPNRLQRAFARHGAAQCGICTPGMLMAATALLAHDPAPDRQAVEDALGGVLCRCTGYQKIVEAVLDAAGGAAEGSVADGAVGARLARVDGLAKVTGRDVFGADGVPADALWLRAVRSPHASARFTLGNLEGFLRNRPGLEAVLTAADVPFNGFGIYPDLKDQPVLADRLVRYRGEAVVAVVGKRAAVEGFRDDDLPISYTPLTALTSLAEAMVPGAPLVQADRPGNKLIDGVVRKGDVAAAVAGAAHVASGDFTTSFVEHAYVEPEAGWAVRDGEGVAVHATTQAPYMDRTEVASVLRLAPEQVRIVPTACGGGFGGKLDVSVQPLIAVAAMRFDRPVACVYSRPESMASSTKRHPAEVRARFACDSDGRLVSAELAANFNTGAYASWGPTVAGRVPVHGSGPYRVANAEIAGAAFFTNGPPAGAFRGFGVPQAAIAHETLMDDLAAAAGIDRLEFRHRNAIAVGDETATGQRLEASAGLAACIDALRGRWAEYGASAERHNRAGSGRRRGIGIGCMWYGIGNTAMTNPSTIRVGLGANGRFTLFNGAVDIGQGSSTVLAQIAAEALGVPVDSFDLVVGDTARTADAGKTSASRQTFVSGKAAELAALDLRAKILRLANAGDGAAIVPGPDGPAIRDQGIEHKLPLAGMDADGEGMVLLGEGTFDPPTQPLDANGQGVPYATYGFAAQIAEVEVDPAFGTVRVLRMAAAHDVGRAINPMLVEGQIHGGIAQGLGLALMEEYLPGRTENLHDYLIPTFGDMPEIEVMLIEDPEPLGPYGAKGVGEPGLVPTAPAILGAIRDAVGVRVTHVPCLPHRLRAAILAKESSDV
ncbi:molybdopterin-dependent oxidoreductase [Oceanibacterium hippocampi]|uniref:Aldehyde oxidoreductase n=1 Tax=Oceanibacterium hippocampi TaxID=745714 RepID=A0A1Y5SFA5_9PROT|nr:molybdopterin cofactor-binding domain-containing protein [Oceanibacterium hippocampi]SLN38693.1 Aldehyde oxidoreductase [Oceanibacterium hippocampi]